MKLLAEGAAKRALDDPKFLVKLPEFSGVKQRTTQLLQQKTTGCSSCAKKRRLRNVLQDFSRTALQLNADGRQRLAEYFGEPVLVRTTDETGKPVREVLQ